MKRLVMLLVVCCSMLSVFATDIILTKKLQRIDVVVLQITDDSIRYQLPNATENQILSMPKTEIESILLSNGAVLQFGDVKAQNSENKIVYADGEFRWQKDNSIIEISEYEELLHSSCATAWEQYSKGTKMKSAGAFLMCFGVPTMLCGIVLIAMGTKSGKQAEYAAGWGVALAGGVLMDVGIPVFCVGKAFYRNSYEPYNEQCVSLNVYSTGVGLAWNF